MLSCLPAQQKFIFNFTQFMCSKTKNYFSRCFTHNYIAFCICAVFNGRLLCYATDFCTFACTKAAPSILAVNKANKMHCFFCIFSANERLHYRKIASYWSRRKQSIQKCKAAAPKATTATAVCVDEELDDVEVQGDEHDVSIVLTNVFEIEKLYFYL